jgi:probable metal-binding protein
MKMFKRSFNVQTEVTEMTDSIHGHEVMQMMLDMGGHFTHASLQAAIEEKFGADARFHTCSARDLTAVTLIEFLEAKGKFIPAADGFNTEEALICKH